MSRSVKALHGRLIKRGGRSLRVALHAAAVQLSESLREAPITALGHSTLVRVFGKAP